MAEDKVIKRGYVKWTDADGVFHKEPLADHPELLASATDSQKLQAEEVRRLNEAGADAQAAASEENTQDTADALAALKAAPPSVLTASQLDEVIVAPAQDAVSVVEPEVHDEPVVAAPAIVSIPEAKVILPAETEEHDDEHDYDDGDHTA
jgi:hypothetical protein